MKTFALVTLLLVQTLGFSQIKYSEDFSIELSKPYPVVDGTIKKYFAVEDGNYTIAIKASNAGVSVHRFDVTGLKEESTHRYEDFPKYSKFVEVIHLSDEKFYYVFEAYNKADKNFSVYYRLIDIEEAKLGSIEKLFTTKGVVANTYGMSFSGMGAATAGRNIYGIGAPKFSAKTSFDKSKIFIGFRNKPKEKNDSKSKDVIGMFVFDDQFQEMWGKEITMPYTEAAMNNLSYGVGNKGNAYILIKQTESNTHELLMFNDDEYESHSLDIDNELFFQKLDVKEKDNGDVVIAGYYANGIDYKFGFGGGSMVINTDGIYYFTIDSEGEIIEKKQIEFPLDFIKLYLSERQNKKLAKREEDGKAGIQGLQIIDIKFNEDGSYVFIGEQQYVMNEPWGTDMSATVYHYGNIVATKVDKDGNVVWMTKMPKNQAGVQGIGGMSVKYVEGNGKHFLLYVDNAKNAVLSETEVPKAHKDGAGGILCAYALDDETGSVEKHLLFDVTRLGKTKLYQFNVTRIFAVSHGKFLLEVYLKGKQDGMVLMWAN